MPAHGPQHAGQASQLPARRPAGDRLAAVVRKGTGGAGAELTGVQAVAWAAVRALACRWSSSFSLPVWSTTFRLGVAQKLVVRRFRTSAPNVQQRTSNLERKSRCGSMLDVPCSMFGSIAGPTDLFDFLGKSQPRALTIALGSCSHPVILPRRLRRLALELCRGRRSMFPGCCA